MKKLYALVAMTTLGISVNAQIVINEVYGGGGNSGSTYTNDFVELVNNGSSAVTLNGAYLQYASTTGSFSAANILALPTINLQPGQYFLIQLAKGAGGTTALPTPDFTPSGTAAPDQPLALSGTGGKIALTSNNTLVTSSTDTNVLDFVGWNTTASFYEGTGPAVASSNSTSISRTNGIDTNDNKADFVAGSPTPQNTASPLLSTLEFNGKRVNLVKNTVVDNVILFGAKAEVKIYSINGQVVKTALVNDGTTIDASSLPKGIYIITGEVDGQKASQKIIKK